ncbi:unnamed protein product [Closterium sp. Yama58-4]|nr:unnamed protein product [Closterium sp. Yama58-4]
MLAAFHAFPFHPMALNHLANHAFLAGPSLHGLVDHLLRSPSPAQKPLFPVPRPTTASRAPTTRSGPLAALALASTEASLPRAEAYYCLACTYHAQVGSASLCHHHAQICTMGDRKKAFAYYKAATETVQPGEFALPYYGLGQIQLSLGDAKAALGTLEKVLAVHPTNSDALKVREGKGGKGGTASWGAWVMVTRQ